MKKQRWTLAVILPLIVLLCFSLWLLKANASQLEADSQDGIWNLRGYDLDTDYVRLGGSHEYILNDFVSPDAFETHADIQVGRAAQHQAPYYTSRQRILVEDGKAYGLVLNSADYADRIYINGQLMQQSGNPATTAAENTPRTTLFYFTVVPQNGQIEVVHHISNYVHHEGGNPAAITIASTEVISFAYASRTQVTAIILGIALLLFVVHLVLFLLQQSYAANLYFALFCLAWGMRTGLTGPKILLQLFPQMSWYVSIRLEYLFIPLATVCMVFALSHMFPRLIHRPVRLATLGISAVFAGIFLFADTITMTQMLLYNQLLLLPLAAYVLIRFFMQLKQFSAEHIIVLCALILLLYVVLREVLYHRGIDFFPSIHSGMLEFGMMVFILFTMTANFFGTMREVQLAFERERALARQNEELDRINAMKNDLLANLSHEMRTPLTVMSTYAQLAVKSLKSQNVDAQTTDDLSTISDEARRLAEMASGFLELFGAQQATRETAVLHIDGIITQISRLFEPLTARNGNRIELQLSADLPPTLCSADAFTQVLWNVLSNANTHTQNGSITIETQSTGDEILVCIADTGRGIDAALLGSVFERGMTTTEGSGLGLPICKEIVEAHGGSIWVESQTESGTKLCFTLPVYRGEADASE
ncbi:sensor histidine kinase [Eubacteriales bacterium OttesenSCG-928-N14]|nr:sensor histidine kinase [Eubacteriales bacterium OttesenSCG-928-N14]